MELNNIINTAITASIPLVILYIGYRIERRQNKIEGKHRTRIQFELEAFFFGPQEGFYVAEVTMLLHNKGLVRNTIKELPLSIRGIKHNATIGAFKNIEYPVSIADFPMEFVHTNVLKRKIEERETKNEGGKEKEWFVEPGVAQRFTYVARIPEDIRFILVRSSIKYHNNSEHTAQKVFEVDVNKAPDTNLNV